MLPRVTSASGVRERLFDLAAIAALAVGVVVLYGGVRQLSWTGDDAFLLHLAIGHGASEHFFSRALWQGMPNPLFTPLVTALYDAELTVLGFEASRFYVVHLILVAASAAAIFVATRLWLSRAASLGAAALVMAGTPVCFLALRLPAQHYFLATALAATAIVLHVLGTRRESTILTIASSVVYLAAMLAKEIAVPLVIVLAVLPEPRRWRQFLPHLVALGAYALWRTWMLGTPLGGYGYVMTVREAPLLVLLTPVRMVRGMAGPDWIWGAPLLLALAAGLIAAMRRRAVAIPAVVIFATSIAIMLPVAKTFDLRLAILLWIAIAVLVAIAWRDRPALIWGVVVLAVVVNRQQWGSQYPTAFRESAEARAFLEMRPDEVLAFPVVPPAAMGELRWLKEDWLGGARGAEWFYDEWYVCTGHASGKRVISWDNAARAVGAAQIEARCDAVRTMPLNISFRHRGETLSWTFGPYADGRWAVIMDDGRQSFTVPSADGFRLHGVRQLSVQVRYDSPEGWRTYTPVLPLDFDRARDVDYSR
jgi:hypothetical protein